MVGRILAGCLVALAVVSLAFTVRELRTRLVGETVPGFVADFRAQSRGLGAETIGVVCQDPSAVSPVDRSRLIAVGWECAPAKVIPVSPYDDGLPEFLVGSSFLGVPELLALRARGYGIRRFGEFAAVWAKHELPPPPEEAPRRGRELAGALFVAALMIGAWIRWIRWIGLAPRAGDLAVAALVTVLVAAVVLRHPLLAPNGLGVFGGKARLWWLAGGVPPGFWSDPGYAAYQSSYPPGLAMLAFAAFAFAGTAGDRLIQLLPSVCAGLLYLTLAAGSGRNPIVRLFVTAFVLSPVALTLYSGFYAEPFAALLLAAGMRTLGRRRDGGWWLVGAAALFRPEGLLLAAFLPFCLRPRDASVLSPLGKAAAFGVLWQVFTLGVGARLQDFRFLTFPGFGRLAVVAAETGKDVLFGCVQNGGIAFAALAGCFFGARDSRTAAWFTLKVTVFLLSASFLLAFNTSPHFAGIVEKTLPRFVWLVSVLLIFPLRGKRGFAIILPQMCRLRRIPDNF